MEGISNGKRCERRASLRCGLVERGYRGSGAIAVSFLVVDRVVRDRARRSVGDRRLRRRRGRGLMRDGGDGRRGGGTRRAADDSVRAARLRVIQRPLGVRLAVLVERAKAHAAVARSARYACGEKNRVNPVKTVT